MREDDRAFAGLRRLCAALSMVAIGGWCFLFGLTFVSGASMEPAMSPGDLVIYRRGGTNAGPGDVVLFEKDGWPGGVLHRVVDRLPDGSVVTQGDANEDADSEPVKASSVRGVAVAVLPLGGLLGKARTFSRDVLNSSTNRMMRSDDGEADGACVPSGTVPHRLQGFRERAVRFTPSAAT